jgi:hypothetical protein
MMQLMFGGMQATAQDMESGAVSSTASQQDLHAMNAGSPDVVRATDQFGKTYSFTFLRNSQGEIKGYSVMDSPDKSLLVESYFKKGWDVHNSATVFAKDSLEDVHILLMLNAQLRADHTTDSSIGIYVTKMLNSSISRLQQEVPPSMYTDDFKSRIAAAGITL